MRPFALLLTALLLSSPPAGAQPAVTLDVRLTAHGGASVQVPAWKEIRKDSAIAVYEQLPEPAANKPFYVLMCALEEGPQEGVAIPWDKVRDNIVQAASKNGRKLALEVGDAFTGVPAFEGRRLLGSLETGTPGKKVAIELLALVKGGKLLTIGLIAEAIGPAENDLVVGVAKSVRLGP